MPVSQLLTGVKHSQVKQLGLVWAPGNNQVLGLNPVLVLEMGSVVVHGPVEGLVVAVAMVADLSGPVLVEQPMVVVLWADLGLVS